MWSRGCRQRPRTRCPWRPAWSGSRSASRSGGRTSTSSDGDCRATSLALARDGCTGTCRSRWGIDRVGRGDGEPDGPRRRRTRTGPNVVAPRRLGRARAARDARRDVLARGSAALPDDLRPRDAMAGGGRRGDRRIRGGGGRRRSSCPPRSPCCWRRSGSSRWRRGSGSTIRARRCRRASDPGAVSVAGVSMPSCPNEGTILHADAGLLLRVRRAARRPRAAWPPRDRRRRASCSPRATRRRRSASARRWAARRRAGCAPTRSSSARAWRPTSEASKAMFEVFDDTTPLVEGLSIDEAFLDVGGLGASSGAPSEIAARLRADVRERVGLPITVGVARTKFLAKVASGVAKPDGLLVVPPDAELDFLHPLPGRAAVGRRSGHRRGSSAPTGITTVGAGRRARRGRRSSRMLGRAAGRHLHALAHNRDPRPVEGGGGGARSAPSGRSDGAAGPRPSSTPISSRSSTGCRAGSAAPTACAAP